MPTAMADDIFISILSENGEDVNRNIDYGYSSPRSNLSRNALTGELEYKGRSHTEVQRNLAEQQKALCAAASGRYGIAVERLSRKRNRRDPNSILLALPLFILAPTGENGYTE